MYLKKKTLDVNECDEWPCGDNTECVNIDGGYSCQCVDGYTRGSDNSSTSCVGRYKSFTAELAASVSASFVLIEDLVFSLG